MADLLKMAFSGFDPEKAHAAYRIWGESGEDDDLSLAWREAVPAIGVVYSRAGFDDTGRITEAEYISTAACRIYSELENRAFKGEHQNSYSFYLQRISMNAFLRETSEWTANRVIDFDYHGPQAPAGRVRSIADVEQHIYLNQLPALLEDMVTDKIRFDGLKFEACVYALRQVLASKVASPRWMKKAYGLAREEADMLVDYVTIRIRLSLYEIRDNIWEGGVLDGWTDAAATYTPQDRVYMES